MICNHINPQVLAELDNTIQRITVDRTNNYTWTNISLSVYYPSCLYINSRGISIDYTIMTLITVEIQVLNHD